ncbi:MAG: hypothetical protein JWM36_3307 [Hyphomicrobiales bacterium]|nr:hypothetical protein [Hyphomicrobiales bacterium]
MTTSRSESEPGAKAIEAALAEPPFAAIAAAGCPIFVAAGQPARIVWSNAAVQDLFGADLQVLQRRIFEGQEPGARRLVELAGMLVPGAAPRLEKLRFFMSRRAELLTILCRRTAGPHSLFLVGVPGMKVQPRSVAVAPAVVAPAASPEEEAVEFSVPVIAPALLETALGIPEAATEPVAPGALEHVAAATQPEMPAPPTRRGIGDVAADLAARLGSAATVRFLWQTDAEHHFVKITGELCDIVGCMTNRLVGRSFIDLADELHLDPDHRLRDALARGETWSGIEVLWPVEGADAALPIMLGALPAHDRERRFEGFRGFGVIHVTRLQPAPEAQTSEEAKIGIPPEAPVAEQASATLEPLAPAPPESVAPVTGESAPNEPAEPVEDLFTPRTPAAPQGASGQGTTGNVVTLRPFHIVPRRPSQDDAAESPQVAQAFAPEMPVAVPGEPAVSEPAPAEPTGRVSRGDEMVSLSPGERLAFREIARALGARVRTDATTDAPAATQEPAPPAEVEASRTADARLRDLIEVATRVAQEAAPVTVEPAAAVSSDPAPDATPASDLMTHAQAVLDRLPIGVLVKRGETALFVNRTLLDLLGYADAQEFRGEDGLTQMFKGRHGEALSETSEGAIPVITHAGDVLALEARMQMMEWDGVTACLMTFRRSQEQDLGHRIRTLETELRASEADMRELHAILDTATDGVAVLDEEGQILSLNRAGEALFGFDQNEVAGESFTILLARDSQEAATEYLAGLRLSGVASVLNDGRDVIGRARQGGSIPLFMTLGRVGAAGKPKFCAVLRDMTSWKKAERELREARTEAETASALKSDFLAKISHEIRTPLNAILGFAEVIMEERFGPVGNERYKDYLKDIHASGSHVMSLVNDLLDLSKIEAGKLELNFGSVDANRIVSECVSLIQPQAARERVIVRLSLAPRLPNIVADERALRQIVLNLLSNAVKFNEPGGQVIVSSALTDAGHAVIRIRDTGIGMSEADIETALEPFRQVATARHTTGTGLGLPLTKALVEANRASFSIKSKKAEGTLVEVAFPPTRVLAE